MNSDYVQDPQIKVGALLHQCHRLPVGSFETWSPLLQSAFVVAQQMEWPVLFIWASPGYLLFNDAFARHSGTSSASFFGKPKTSLFLRSSPSLEAAIDRVLASGLPMQLKADNGPAALFAESLSKEISIMLQPVYDRQGKTEGIQITFLPDPGMSVSAEKSGVFAPETVLKPFADDRVFCMSGKDNDPFRLCIKAGKIGLWYWNIPENKLCWSEEQEALYGLAPGSFSGNTEDFYQFILPEDREIFLPPGKREGQSRNGGEYQFRIRRADGEVRWIQVRSKSYYHQEVLLYTAGASIDITSQIVVKEELIKAKKELELAFRHSPSSIFHYDHQGQLLFLNDQAARLLGGGDAESLLKLVSLQDVRLHLRSQYYIFNEDGQPLPGNGSTTALSLENGTPSEKVLQLKHKQTGECRWIKSASVPLFSKEGLVQMVITSSTDITTQKITEEKLRESEDRYTLTLAASHLGIWDLNVPGHQLISAGTMAAILGYEPGESIPADCLISQVHPEDQKKVKRMMEKLNILSSDPYFETEHRIIQKNSGKIRWVQQRGQALYNEQGRLVRILGTLNDITTQKVAQQQLIESEQRFRSLANDTPAYMFIADEHTNIEFVNRPWSEFVGLDGVESMGKAWMDVTHPDDVEPMLKTYREAVATGTPYHFEIRQRHTNGEYRWILWNGIPRMSPDGALISVVGLGIDVTEQKKIQQIILDNERKFRQLADLVPQIIFTADAQGFMDYYNRRWYEFTGQPAGYGDASWQPFVHPEDVELLTQKWYHSVETGEPHQLEFRIQYRQSGVYRWFLAKALPVRDEEGNITKWFGSCTDIHDHRNLTEQLEMLVQERTRELARVNRDLYRSNEDLQQFAHVASHDLKEPVRKIRTFVSRIQYEFGPQLHEQLAFYLNKIEVSSARMYSMIDSVLLYSSLNSGDTQAGWVDLKKITADILTDLEVLIESKSARIQVDSLPQMFGYETLLYQLIYNLLVNALKFTSPEKVPEIWLKASLVAGPASNKEVSAEETGYELVVQDNGIGFPQEQADHIFMTFSRLNTKDQYEGSGMGLALCKKIAERHGGSIRAEGRPGKGARFLVYLPVKEPQIVEPALP